MASEVYPSASEIHTERTEVFQLEALSLNFLRSISKIPDVEIPKLHPCKLCNKDILTFRFQEFTVLSCGHILHRTCLGKHIIRAKTQFPTCPTCPTSIEIIREELALATGKYDTVVERIEGAEAHQDLGKKASQQSNDTIDDDNDLEYMRELGLIVDETFLADQGKQTDKAPTKDQATSPIPDNSTCNRASSPIVIEDISTTPEDSGNQASENNESNTNTNTNTNEENITKGSKSSSHSVTASGNSKDQTNDTTKTRSSRQSSPKIDRERDVLQGLLKELSTPIKGEPDENNDETGGGVDESTSQSLARLYQKASRAGVRVMKANHEEILCWYQYAEGFENRVIEIRSKDRAVTDPTARSRVYHEVAQHLPGITEVNLRKKTQKARNIYRLFVKIEIKKINRVKSYSADAISSLSSTQIQSIIDRFSMT